MEGSNQGGKPSKGADFPTLTVLQERLPELFAAFERKKKGANGTRNSTDDNCMDLIHDRDAMALLQHLRASGCGASRICADVASESCGNSSAPAATLVSTPPLGPVERMQQKRVNTMPTKKRRKDGVSPLSTAGTSPSSFAIPASSGMDDNSGSTIAPPSRNRNAKSVLSESPRRLPRDALGSGGKVDGQFTADNSASDFSSGMAIVQLMQQCSGGVCLSLDRSDDAAEETDGASGGALSNPSVTNSSSSLNGGVTLPMGPLSERRLQAQLAAALSWGSPVTGMERDDEDEDDSGRMSRMRRSLADAPSNLDDPLMMMELLRCIDPHGHWVLQKADAGGDDVGNGEKLYGDDSDNGAVDVIEEDEEDEVDVRSFYGEDPDYLKKINKMDTLSLSTMRELATCWGIQFDEDEDDEVYRGNITEHFRLLAVTIVSVLSDRFEAQTSSTSSSPGGGGGGNNNNGNGNKRPQNGSLGSFPTDGTMSELVAQREDERVERVRRVLLSLRHDIFRLNSDHLRHFANIFGFVDRSCTPEEIFMAISALGVLTFFQPLPTPLLEKVCQELSIPTNDKATESVDPNQLPLLLAQKISHYFYPLRQSVPSITKFEFMPEMQIHEHAPGRYTCTIDHANLMKVLTLQRLISNRFSCNKIRWHAILTVVNEQISFCVWHRHSEALQVHMVIRTQDPKKKRKSNSNINNNNNNNNNKDSPQIQEISLKETSALYLEREIDAAPGELVGFENFVSLPDALRSSTMSQFGYRLYNSAEDRLVFQYAMELMNIDGSPFMDKGRTQSNSTHQNGKTTSTKRGSNQNGDPSNDSERAAALEEEKRQKEWGKVVFKLGKSETQGREIIEQAWNNCFRQLMNEHSKAYQKAVQKKKERERKLLLAKVGPNPELQRELDVLNQTVTTNRAQVAKLTKEKVKEEENIERLQVQIEEGNLELERLEQLLKSRNEVLSNVEAETANHLAKAKEREEAKRRKQEWTPALSIPELSTMRHETLAINDLQSFWAPPCTNGINSRDFGSAITPTRSSPQCSPQILPTAAPGMSPMALATTGSNGSGPSIPLPRSAAVSNGGTFSSSLLPSSTDGVIGADLTSWAPLTDSSGFTGIRGNNNMNTVGRYDSLSTAFSTQLPLLQTDSAHISGMDIMGGGSSVGQSSGFTVTAPFTTANAIARFTLDANARPFTPTSMVGGQTSSSTASHSNYTATAGVASVVPRSPATITSPMAGMSGQSPIVGSGVFPEKPRYTSVSTPVPASTTTAASTTSVTSSHGVFSTGPIQSTASLFGLPGPSNGMGTTPQQLDNGLSLNFTTAPWN
ncbi:uncharacterized protein TM35_000161660 [Trypanosoma theileri]|uniref:Uncharacterized protein n=1 Tax=Trypanosoma theileri TaxID=67003 RepID=A0A1X0NVG1_9TRYP|nr:uncharacterized protein TM35_000161660 [Trypanosoma theileri]ORC88528.1 hypothetical protein TM35_000161660 [Trypanosoma theileri]